MRCFYHGDVEAVAVCKACGHGVCHDCCAEVGTSAACRNRCESDVAALNDIVERGRSNHLKISALYTWIGLFFGAIAAFILIVGVRSLGQGGVDYFSMVIGSLFMAFAGICFRFAYRFRRK